MADPEHVYRAWSAAFEGMHHYGRSFALTMHPYTIGRPGRLDEMLELIQYTFPGVHAHEPPATLTRDQEAAVLDRGSAVL